MKVKVLKSCAGANFSYTKGKTYELNEKQAGKLIKAGYAQSLEGEQETADKKPSENTSTRRKKPVSKKQGDA